MNSAHHILLFIKTLTKETKEKQRTWVDNFGCFETHFSEGDMYLIVDDDMNEALIIITDIPSFHLKKEKILLCNAHMLFWPSMAQLIREIYISCSLEV